MNKDNFETRVCFRKFPKHDVIAIFPDTKGMHSCGTYMSYERVGQHGPIVPEAIAETVEASEEEYASLKRELENIGYNLKVDQNATFK